MSHKIHPRQSIGTATARELDVIVRRLWSIEPRCSPTERTMLLTELVSVGLAVERIILRDQTRTPARPATDGPRCDLDECERRIQNLLDRWPRDHEARTSPLVAA